MNNEKFEPQKLYLITSDEQIKGYVHPTRMVLLQMLAKEKRTISSIAKELNVHPANITHHFKLLEKIGLICLVEKRDTGKNLEKYYRAIAYNFEVKPQYERDSDKNALALSVLKNDLTVAINTVRGNRRQEVLALLGTARIHPQDVSEFIKKLDALFAEFKSRDTQDGLAYNINLSLYPNDTNCTPHNKVIID
jgi:DNA-binding transcriptional ArsR family regulator